MKLERIDNKTGLYTYKSVLISVKLEQGAEKLDIAVILPVGTAGIDLYGALKEGKCLGE